ncbi:hypothetical protein B0H19DRAFT_1274646 [Mycena capillaripes]|nr:hypothetical protein B0H19DRAFT_1274646 [Mycena capillaripes]
MRIRSSSRVRLRSRAALQSVNQRRPKSNVPTATLADPSLSHRSICAFDACERDMTVLRAYTSRSARRAFLPRVSVVYHMHSDYMHYPLPAPALLGSTARNAMRSETPKPLLA